MYIDPAMDDLVHPDTTLINIPSLDIKNYGALYAEPVALDLAPGYHPDQYTILRQQKLWST